MNGFLTCCCSGEGLFHTTFTGALSFLFLSNVKVDLNTNIFIRYKHVVRRAYSAIFLFFLGPGEIWIQSMSIDKMRRLFPPKVQQSGGGDTSGGSSA